MADFRLTPLAIEDLDEIQDFIANRKDSPENAEVVENYLFDAMARLAENPSLGHANLYLPEHLRIYRQEKYYIIYDATRRPVEIIRIAGIWRELTKLFQE